MAVAEKQVLCSLYVGDLDSTVTEEQLIKTFSGIPDFHSAVLCKDSLLGRPLGYGYVNYNTLQSATEAMNTLNHTVINGKAVRVMWSQSNSEARTSGIGNLFVKNMASSIDNSKLHDIFTKCGTILSCKVEVSQDGKIKGFGFVQFATQESANNAIEKLHGREIEGKELYVAHFIRRRDRLQADGSFTNLYLKNLDKNITEELLEKEFSKFEKITSLVISRDDNGVSKGFGFINFEKAEDAKRAKESMHGTQMGSNVLYVAKAQKKAEREKILRIEFDRLCKERTQKGLNLYIKNLSNDVDDIQLRAYFTPCGNITSAKVMRTDKGLSRGFGFVSFSRPEEADLAINKYNGVMFHGKPLYVAKAQSKEERRAYLQTLYARHGAELPGLPRPMPSTSNFTPFSLHHPRPLQVYQPPDFRLEWGPNGFAPLNGHRKPRVPPLRPMESKLT